MYLAQLFIPFLQFTEIYITSFWSGGFTTPTAVNQRNGNLGNSIFVHFEMTFLTTLTGILDFANLIFQTGIFSQFKLGKKSNWIFQTGECQKFLQSQCRQIGGRAWLGKAKSRLAKNISYTPLNHVQKQGHRQFQCLLLVLHHMEYTG